MKKFAVIVLLVMLTGCAGTASIQHTLEDRKGPLMYVHDSTRIEDKKAGTVAIGNFTVGDILTPDTVVKNKSSSLIPLLFFNKWTQEDQARLGSAQLANDYKQFLRESLLEELKRSSVYALKDSPGDVMIEISIKKIEMSAPINQEGFFFFALILFGGGNQTTAGPVDVTVAADVRASRGGAIVLDKELHGNFRTNILKGKNAILQDYTIAMIEGTSMAIKDLNEKIVLEINKI